MTEEEKMRWFLLRASTVVGGRVQYFDEIFEDKFDFSNIFSFEINAVSNSILNKKTEVDYPGISRQESETNIKILDKWLNEKN